jgi:serine protease Do
MGMNAAGIDNRQLALNIMHWLSGLKGLDASVSPSPSSGTVVRAPSGPEPRRPMGTAEIAAESEASIALIAGADGTGTGFLIAPGLLLTNSHVIEDEFMPQVKVRFPSAEKNQQGPLAADLRFEDAQRDLAILEVKSGLPPLRIAPGYTFRKGEDIVVIGNPGAGGRLILENAISRGIMSTRVMLENYPYYQLGISVNPGNSGGPVFDSTGAVIGVLSRGNRDKEGLAYCIPVEDVHAAIKKAAALAPAAIERERARHRLVAVVKGLGNGGACYSLGVTFYRRPQVGPQGKPIAKTKRAVQALAGAVAALEKNTLPNVRSQAAEVQNDPLVAQPLRDKVAGLVENLEKYKALYARKGVAQGAGDPFPELKATHRRLLNALFSALNVDRPEYMFVFNLVPAGSGSNQADIEKAEAEAVK